METIDINANLREKVGKGSARFARRNGLVPAVIYGNKESALSISIDAKSWKQLVQKQDKIIKSLQKKSKKVKKS